MLQADLNLTVEHFSNLTSLRFEEGWEPICDKFAGFYFGPFERFTTRLVFLGVSILGAGFAQIPRLLMNADYRTRTLFDVVMRFDPTAIKLLASFGESPISTRWTPFVTHGLQPNVIRTVYIERQKKFMLNYDLERRSISIEKDHQAYLWGTKPIRCRLLHQAIPREDCIFKDMLIIHCHGGGFVTGTPDSHEVYLRGWAKELPGVPILTIDYALSPANKFPIAQQQILDVYLWTLSKKPEVEQMLGFHPKGIVVSGDSSGGLILMVNAMIINDIKKQYPSDSRSLIIPKSLVGFYSSFTIESLLTPSFINSCVHPFLFPSVFCNMVYAYLPDGRRPGIDGNGNPLPLESSVDLRSWGERIWSFIKAPFVHAAWYWRSYVNLFDKTDLWYMQGPVALKAKLMADIGFTKHAYLSPLNYDDFDSLSSMSLHLTSMPFEPILDHSIMMAKKWKGEVTFDIMGELVHCYLNLLVCGGEYEQAYKHSIGLLRKALLE